MTANDFLFISPVLLAGGFLKGAVGFGAPLTIVPFLSLFFAPREAVVLIAIPILLMNLVDTVNARAEWRSLSLTPTYFLAAVLCVPLGVIYLRRGDPDAVRLLMGLMAYLYLALGRRLPPMAAMRPGIRGGVGAGMGALLGFAFGATSISGPINTIYFTMLRLSKNAFIFQMNAFNSLGASALVVSLASQGAYASSALALSLTALAPVFLGYAAGLRLRARIPQALFFRIVRYILFLLATSLVVRFLWSLL